MALSTITGAVLVRPGDPDEAPQSDSGPIRDGNGNLYFVAFPSGATTSVRVFKSSNGGTSWSGQNTGSEPSNTNGYWQVAARLVGTRLHIVTQSATYVLGMGNVTDIEYHTFDVSTAGGTADTWQTTNDLVYQPDFGSLSTGFQQDQAGVAIEARASDFVIVHPWTEFKDMGISFQQIGFSHGTAGSWTNVAFGDFAQHRGNPFTVKGTSDAVHVIGGDHGTSEVWGRTIRSNNTLSTEVSIMPHVSTSFNFWNGIPAAWDDGGTFRALAVALYNNVDASSNELRVRRLTESSGDLAVDTAIIDIADAVPAGDTPNAPPAAAVDPNDNVYALWADGASDLVYDVSANGANAGWGTDTELEDAITSYGVLAHYYNNSIGYVVVTSSGGALGYGELSLTGAQTVAVGTLAETDSLNPVQPFLPIGTLSETDSLVPIAVQTPVGRDQRFRVRSSDTVGLNVDSDWAGALNADVSIDMDYKFRIRFEIEETAGTSVTAAYKTQFRVDRGGGFGTWADVPDRADTWPPVAQGNTPEVFIVDSGQYADGAATTDLLSGSAESFTAGSGENDNATGSVTLQNQHTEFEWTLVIPRWWDNGTSGYGQKNDPGDVFEFRVVETGGTLLDFYTNVPTITASLAAGHIGGTYIEQPSQIGPFFDGNGNMYVFAEFTNTANRILLSKSTDDGVTWDEPTTTGRPVDNDPEGFSAFQVGDVLHVVTRGGDDQVWYHRYHMSSHATTPDTWNAIDVQVDSNAGAPAGVASEACDIWVRPSDGYIFVVYNGNDGSNDVVWYNRSENGGAAWQTRAVVDSQAGRSYTGCRGVLGVNTDDLYIFIDDNTNGVLYYERILDTQTAVTGTLTSVATNLGTIGQVADNILPPVCYDDGGVEVVMVAWQADTAGDVIESRTLRDNALQTAATASDNGTSRSWGQSHQPTAAMANDGSTVHLLYADKTTDDIFYDTNPDEGGWGTDTEEQDAITAHYIRARVGTHTGKVLGYVWETGADGVSPGFSRYDEIVLAGGQTIAVGTLTEIDSLVTATAVKPIVTSVGTLAQLDSLVATTGSKTADVGTILETDSLLAAAPLKVAVVGTLAETDTLITIQVLKPQDVPVNTLAELESLVAASPFKTVTVGTLAELNNLIAIGAVKPIVASVGVLGQTDTLISVTGLKTAGVGTLSEVDSLIAVDATKTIITPVGTLAELETLIAVQALKLATIGTISETDALIAAQALKPIVAPVGTLSEVGTLIAVQALKLASIGTISESDALIAVEALKPIIQAVGTLAQADTLIPIDPAVGIGVGTLAETDSLLAIQALKPIIQAVGTLSQLDALISVAGLKAVSVGTLSELDLLVAVEALKPIVAAVGTLAEAEILNAIQILKTYNIGTLAEIETLIAVQALKPILQVVGTLGQTDTLISVGGIKTAPIGTIAELNQLIAIAGGTEQVVPVNTLAEVETLVGIEALKPIIQAVGIMSELENLISVSGIKTVSIGTLAELDALVSVSGLKQATVGTISEVDSLVSVLAQKVATVGTLAESDVLVSVASLKTADVGTLAEIETLLNIAGIKTVHVGVLSETNNLIAIAVETPTGQDIAVGTLAEIDALVSIAGLHLVDVGTLSETEVLQAIQALKPIVTPVGTLATSDLLVPVSPLKLGTIGTLAEVDALVAIEALKPIFQTVGTLNELDTLIQISGLKGVGVGTLSELDSLLSVGGAKTAGIGTLSELDLLVAVEALKPILRNVGTLSESNSLVAAQAIIGALIRLVRRTSKKMYDTTRSSGEYDPTHSTRVGIKK